MKRFSHVSSLGPVISADIRGWGSGSRPASVADFLGLQTFLPSRLSILSICYEPLAVNLSESLSLCSVAILNLFLEVSVSLNLSILVLFFELYHVISRPGSRFLNPYWNCGKVFGWNV